MLCWQGCDVALPARFIRIALNEPLVSLGFTRVGRRHVWLRDVGRLQHAVSLEYHWGSWGVRWDVVHPGVGELLHGKLVEPARVAYSGFIGGWASTHHPPPGVVVFFERDDIETKPGLAEGVAKAAVQVGDWTSEFDSVRGTLDYLLQAPGDKLPDKRVISPAHWPLRIYTAAALATVEREPGATELAERAIEALARFRGSLTDERIERLTTALN